MTNHNINIVKNDVITSNNQQDNYIVHLGYIGGYLTGTVGLGISIITLFLVFITFNNEKRKIDRQRFEDHFFYLINNQRNNMINMRIEKRISNQHKAEGDDKENLLDSSYYSAEKAVLKIFREFFEINKKVSELFNGRLDSIKSANISYIVLYYGLGHRSINIVENIINCNALLDIKSQALLFDSFDDGKRKRKIREKFAKNKKISLSNLEDELRKLTIDNCFRKEISLDLGYPAAGGHQTRLDHYFSNLLFCFDLIQEQRKNMIDEDLLIYKKEILSQLNVYEKILIILHSNTIIGQDFQKYLSDYNFDIHIPTGMIKKEEFDMDEYFAILRRNFSKK